ncbi:MAG: type IV pili methyl-accepting chemotaxis transducer N-terminal domain-containing protein [Aquabacterium sp.]|uniref:methyl-accepting chemotaxis protein n=1 Tax=Aquabacterium sp. TaxID=1872578 RepID=UPI0025B94B29|nr:methyl-accepting chemotaxis protein [Aquabacterium sp.]MBI3383498.1 type IV pili methyl-accepting chemotaxis transducer N-terminal domain-containing protein [Aquabacterium sp.]
MSFLSRIKDLGKTQDDDEVQSEALSTEGMVTSSGAQSVDTQAAPSTIQPGGSTITSDSIISEDAPSEFPPDYHDNRLKNEVPDGPLMAEPQTGLPVIGKWRLDRQQRFIGGALGVGMLGLLLSAFLSVTSADRRAAQTGATGQALMQSQRLAKSVSQALIGRAQAFGEVADSSKVLASNVRGLDKGDSALGLSEVHGAAKEELTKLLPLVDRAEKNADYVLKQKQTLTQVSQALREVNSQSSELLDLAEGIATTKIEKGGVTPAEASSLNQLVMLTQRIGKSANEFLTVEGVSTEAVFLLGKDLNAFKEIAEGLLNGNADLKLVASKDPAVREQLDALLKIFERTRTQSTFILGSLQGLVAARDAQVAVIDDSEPLRKGLETVQQKLTESAGIGGVNVALILVFLLITVAAAYGLLRVFLTDQNHRRQVAEQQRQEAERLEREAKRVNDANQAAILRLMNELQLVAEGDLTQQATVTEDITGAIADSVNFTVEELRNLVAQVQGTVQRVTETTGEVEATSTELLAASDEQLREIRETGESVLQMAGRINEVSAQAQHSAEVARQSLAAADSGLQAVQNAIGGMNTIREQIQETSKRIKRLGESSQEIGEITELISDITEQTNVLALNAAIQAASAGEAGRGFSVVAEEVQRLAERSADATREIAALVRTIQTDTQDAVGAMERSTQGVVEGARLSDAAGSALGDIDRVSRRLAELIEQISSQALREAESANVVVANIQHIFAVTEQTGEGTRSTTQLVRELSRTANELQQSVARFKIAS